LYSFLIELKHCVASQNTRSISSDYKRLEPLLAYIEEKFHKEMTLEEMAGVIEASPQYLCRLFKYSMQMTPIAYLTRFRLQKAKEILLGPKAVSVSETARSVGYRDTSYFCSVFKQHEGTTPLEFRKYYK
jgi:YesN/AraC family two-component response regulator